MGLFRKSFEKKYLRKMSPDEVESRKLQDELKIIFYPHTNEREYFFDLGFPRSASKLYEGYGAEFYNWRPKVSGETNSGKIRLMLYEVKNKTKSLDEVTEKIFGYKTFEEFIDYVKSERKQTTVAASEETLNLLKNAKPSKEWDHAIRNEQPDATVMRWLEDLGNRLSTHSSVGELFQVRRSEVAPYTESARIGFCAINYVLRKNKMKFQAKKTRQAGDRLVGDCCSLQATAPLLLQEICEESLETIAQLISNLDSQMKQMLGFSPTKAKTYFSNSPMPYEVTLWETAHRAAMLAAISYDPTACKIYKGLFLDSTLIDPKTAEWFQREDHA